MESNLSPVPLLKFIGEDTADAPVWTPLDAVDAWADKCAAIREPGESGPAALQLIDELQKGLAMLGLSPHIGPIEQQCHELQRILITDENFAGSLRPIPPRTSLMMRFVPVQLWPPACVTLASNRTGRQFLSTLFSVAERDPT